MRVCLISREYPPDTGWGGIATFANHLAHGLTQLGHDVEVVSLAKEAAGSAVQDGILVHRVLQHFPAGDLGPMAMCMPYSRYVVTTATALWKKFFELHRQNPFDVVDTPELLAEGLIPAVTGALPLVIRLYTPHSKFIAEKLHNVTPSFDHLFVAMLERIAMLQADALTSPSEDLADFVSRDLNYPRERIRIIRNPIDPEKFSPEGPGALAPDGRKTVLFVGRLEERKGIGYLVNAIPRVLSEFANVRFVIVGDDTNNGRGQRSVLAELKNSIDRHGCGDSVIFIPRVPLDMLADYYRSADICVVPSVYDNSPYTCLEAMSCGRPVIGTSAGGTAEYLGDTGVIVPPRDEQAIAAAVIDLLRDQSRCAELGRTARLRVLEKFQRTRIAGETAALYEEAVERFAVRGGSRFYLKNASDALGDSDLYLFAYDRMIYDLLYQQSWRFRIKHWFILATRRPKLLAAKVFVRLASTLVAISGRSSDSVPEAVARLEQDIRERQDPMRNRNADQRSATTAGPRR